MRYISLKLSILLFFFGFSIACGKSPQVASTISIADAFINLPNRYIDVIPKRTRQEMVVYMQHDSIASVTNSYLGKSKIEKMSADYIKVKITDASSLELKLLNTSSKKIPQIIMSVYTVGADSDTTDSTIKFFDSSMNELKSSLYFSLPDPEEFFNIPKNGSTTMDEITGMIPFYTVEYNISEENPPRLTGKLTISEYLTIDQKDKIQPFIIPYLEWNWDGKKFRQAQQ